MEQEQLTPAVIDLAWEWPDEIDDTTMRRMAQATLALFMQPERWIHRRVERIYFKNHESAHHQVSVDFTLPANMNPVGLFDGNDIYIAPLFLLVKNLPKPLREGKLSRRRFMFSGERAPDLKRRPVPMAPYSNLDFRNQDGRRLPLLTRRQGSLLATTMLLEVAKEALGEPIPEEIEENISAIPMRSWPELEPILEWLVGHLELESGDPRNQLRKDPTFSELAYTLASHSIITCLLMDGAPRRSIHKLSYDEIANDSVSKPKGGLWRSLGWAPEQYYVALNEIGASASYHVEIEVPKELEISAISLIGKRYKWYDDRRSGENLDYSIQQVGCVNEGKIYIPEPLLERRVGLAWVNLRARRSGFLAGALVASGFTTILLWLAAIGAPEVVRNGTSEPATAALLLVPALIAAYVVRPGHHAVTEKMLRWARRLLVLNATFPALAVFFLIVTPGEIVPNETSATLAFGPFSFGVGVSGHIARSFSELRIWWGILAVFSLMLSLLFIVSYIMPRPRGETLYRPMPKVIGNNEGSAV